MQPHAAGAADVNEVMRVVSHWRTLVRQRAQNRKKTTKSQRTKGAWDEVKLWALGYRQVGGALHHLHAALTSTNTRLTCSVHTCTMHAGGA